MSEQTTRPLQPTIWITRTAPAAFKSAEVWAREGYAAAVAPILEITSPKIMPELPPRDGVVVFTSGNGVNAFTRSTLLRHWPDVTVGAETKRIAHDLGFRTVTSAGGTSENVTQIILKNYKSERPIYHCSGNHVRGSITEDLTAKGYQAQRDIYYLSAPVKQLPKVNVAQMDFVAIYSPLAAKTIAAFAPDLSGATILSISEATDAALGAVSCKARFIADVPTERALLEAMPRV